MKELLRDGVIAFGLDRADDLAQQQHVRDGCLAEELFLAQDLGVGELRTRGRDGGVALVDRQEAKQLGGVHNGQQVINLKGEIVGQPVNVVFSVVVEQELEQAGDATGTCVRKHLVMHEALIAGAFARGGLRQFGWLCVRLGEHFVDVVPPAG